MPPIEPPSSAWTFPDLDEFPESDESDELVGVGADLEAGTLLMAYRRGLFPMPLASDLGESMAGNASIGWWSPDPRGVLHLDELIVSRSLRRSLARYEIRIDSAFDEVINACGDPDREHGWIDDNITRAYRELFRLGWVHSVEAWNVETGALAGGLYGVAVNGLFAGESMFHRETDASKVALVALVALLRDRGFGLLDTQWATDHLTTLGVTKIPRNRYRELLHEALILQPEPLAPLNERVKVVVTEPRETDDKSSLHFVPFDLSS